ncbi:MAG: hypothetical protein AB1656_19805 [Candidatus Omnitrophota bacterium]
MWLFTSRSFVSIVVDKDNPGRRLVRARCKGDIEELFPDADVFEDQTADYRYRTSVSTDELIEKLTEYIEDMDYANFKNSIPPNKKKYRNACIGVWSLMLGLQKIG